MTTSDWKYFPYNSFKPNQEALLSAISDAVGRNSHAIIDGASGLGKTVGSLAGAIQACKPRGLRILYAARTYKELDRVVEELTEINKREKVSGISIRGRSETCVNDAVLRLSRDPKTVSELCADITKSHRCPYFENMEDMDRTVRSFRDEFLDEPTSAYRLICTLKENDLCPYEMIKLLLPHLDVIALSYAYLFDRTIREPFMKKLSSGEPRSLSQYVVILDEAHNLPEIANDYESDSITSISVSMAAQEASHYGKADVERFAESLAGTMKGMGSGERLVNIGTMIEGTMKEARINERPAIFLEEVHAFGEKIKYDLLAKEKIPRSYIHRLGEFFLKGQETASKREYAHILHAEEQKGAEGGRGRGGFGDGHVAVLEIVSLDPRSASQEVINNAASSVSMSGTLEDTEAYRKVMGLPEDSLKISLPSPFGEHQTLVLACKGVSTLYERRGEESYSRMVSKIAEAATSTPASTGVFCSSYGVLEGLIAAGLERAVGKPLYVERQRTKSTEQDRLLEEFKSMSKKGGAVLAGVMGGRFSEGEDYPGDEMNTVVIVGVPYPKPSAKVNAQIEYYESIFPGKGREYGYVLPAMRKAAQAAGRPFRNLDDRGAVVFLDYRFCTSYLSRFLPVWLRERMRQVEDAPGALRRVLGDFYS